MEMEPFEQHTVEYSSYHSLGNTVVGTSIEHMMMCKMACKLEDTEILVWIPEYLSHKHLCTLVYTAVGTWNTVERMTKSMTAYTSSHIAGVALALERKFVFVECNLEDIVAYTEECSLLECKWMDSCWYMYCK